MQIGFLWRKSKLSRLLCWLAWNCFWSLLNGYNAYLFCSDYRMWKNWPCMSIVMRKRAFFKSFFILCSRHHSLLSSLLVYVIQFVFSKCFKKEFCFYKDWLHDLESYWEIWHCKCKTSNNSEKIYIFGEGKKKEQEFIDVKVCRNNP